jgi:hypothetical protein
LLIEEEGEEPIIMKEASVAGLPHDDVSEEVDNDARLIFRSGLTIFMASAIRNALVNSG